MMNVRCCFTFLLWFGPSHGMFGDKYSPEVQGVKDGIDNLEEQFLKLLKAEKEAMLNSLEEGFSKLRNLNTELGEKEHLLSDQNKALNDIVSKVEQEMVKHKEIEESNVKLELENEKLIKLKVSLKTKIDQENSLLETVSKNVKAENDKMEKLNYEINQLEKDVEHIKEEKSKFDQEIVSKREIYNQILAKVENAQTRQSLLDDKILSLEQEQSRLTNENSKREAIRRDLDEDINHKNVHKKDLENTIITLESTKEDLKKERDELKKDNKQLQKEICKEHYTLFNWEFLTNNKTSTFTSLVLALLVGASMPLIIKLFAPMKSNTENNSFNEIKEVFKEASPSRRLEHMSDDEDNEMVPSSSVFPKRDLKYNYDRDCMEENDDPEGCLDYIKKKYGIKKNLFNYWEALKSLESTAINVWETRNDELRFTKLLLKKTLKKPKKVLLSFELFQTKLKDAFSYSDYEETELKEKDTRIEAKLAWKIYEGLPNFSV